MTPKILAYATPWRVRAHIGGIRQSGSQDVNRLPLSEALDNVILIVEDQIREDEAHNFEDFKTAVVQGAGNSVYVTAAELEAPGHTVACCSTPLECARPRAIVVPESAFQ